MVRTKPVLYCRVPNVFAKTLAIFLPPVPTHGLTKKSKTEVLAKLSSDYKKLRVFCFKTRNADSKKLINLTENVFFLMISGSLGK